MISAPESTLMFLPESRVRVWLCTRQTDMRKSFTGLSAQVKNRMGENPISGELFVFVNKRRAQMKVLYFDRTGYCIWSKRLEQGQFVVRQNAEGKRLLDWVQLKLLLEGIEVKKYRQFKRYQHPSQPASSKRTRCLMSLPLMNLSLRILMRE